MRLPGAPSRCYFKSNADLHVPLVWLSLLLSTAMAQMPYIPTRILQNGPLLYVFQPSSGSSSQFELGSINLTATLTASALPYTTLYPSLPFLDADARRTFTPVLDNGGNITVYTGDCARGVSGAEVWAFTPDAHGQSGNGTWNSEQVSVDQDDDDAAVLGSNYLNAGVAFSSVVGGDSLEIGAYFFGGMCPFDDAAKDWQSAANYSNFMVTMEPSQDGTKAMRYQIDESSSRGPPIAEAGFTLTGLQPSFSNKSDGTQTQQQNFVLVGGHTRSAFINMSQVALFSLPQQGWTFVPVSQPNTQRTDLSVRKDITQIEPRSGHTAVLTPDGQRIIVFGGWIGDVDTPADPQLAVLSIGEGYGGQGNWEWTVPSTSGSGLPSNSGVYGHGAAMLPGGVMMITGGYPISARRPRWRRAGGSQTLFFNVTSNSWISEYTPPKTNDSSTTPGDGPLSKAYQKAGLGVGLGIGMAAVLSLLAFYLWYTRRCKKERESREKQLRELAMGAQRYHMECLTPGMEGRGGNGDAMGYFDESNDSYFYSTPASQRGQGWRSAHGHDAERTGLLVEIPSPTRGLRRNLSGRGPHHMTSRYDERRVRGSGDIHPIDELEEEEHEAEHANDKTPLAPKSEMSERTRKTTIFDNAPALDPFTDNHRTNNIGAGRGRTDAHSAPASPIREESPTHFPKDWHPGMGVVQTGRSTSSSGRESPDKSERTGSNLSERSTRSELSSSSASGSLGRAISVRSTAIINNASHANPFKTPDASPTSDKPGRGSAAGWHSPVDPRTLSFTSVRSNGRPATANADADSFMTARTSFMQLQAEGEALLGGNPDRARPGTASTSNGSNPSNSQSYRDTDATISRIGTITAATSPIDGSNRPRRKSWLGSVRRVLTRSTTAVDPRTRSLTTATSQMEPYTDDPVSPTTMLSRDRMSFPASNPPRRAASDASFWRSKRGKQDWLDDELDPNDPRAKWRRTSGDDWGAPEDLAFAEKERRRREWRERGNLINLNDDDALPTRRTTVHLGGLTTENRPSTPADEEDWDVEAAVERRVVQVMFTVPKSKLRVVNADVDNSSMLSLPLPDSSSPHNNNNNTNNTATASSSSAHKHTNKPPTTPDSPPPNSSHSPSRVKDLVGRFERESQPSSPSPSVHTLTPKLGTPRQSPRPSPSPSIRSVKVRNKKGQRGLGSGEGKGKGKERVGSRDIVDR